MLEHSLDVPHLRNALSVIDHGLTCGVPVSIDRKLECVIP